MPSPSTIDVDNLLGNGPIELALQVIAHDDAVQREMDRRKISWGVQFEIARGITQNKWTWQQVTTTKLDKLKGCSAVSAPLVANVMLDETSDNRPTISSNSLW